MSISISSKNLKGLGLVEVDGMLRKIRTEQPVPPKNANVKRTIKKESLGKCHFNNGMPTIVRETKFVMDKTRRFYVFDVVPMGAVRMSQSDKWKTNPNHPDPRKRKRESVVRYHNFKNRILDQAHLMNFELGQVFEAVYLMPMPNTWSIKKKREMVGLPNKVRPDTDNITKAIKDTLRKEDGDIWCEKAEKRWAYLGSILIYQ